MTFDNAALWNLAIALLGGLAVGIERQWSGHALGPRARFAGVRTFTLLALVAGLSGWFWTAGLQGFALIFLAGLGALVVVAYHAASRNDVDGTTEVAAFVVLAAGVLAGAGSTRVAAAIIAITILLLVEKRGLHRVVSKMDRVEIRAGARFAIMAAVILPLLPEGPYGPYGGIKPRQLWALVLFFSGISFLGYIARRALGKEHGYVLAGALGGVVSSTSTTLTFARLSRDKKIGARALAAGAMGANLMLFPRVLIASAVLAPALALALWPAFVIPILIGALMLLLGLRQKDRDRSVDRERNPLQFWAALQMAVLFQAVLFGISFVIATFGEQSLFPSAALLGLTDTDALTMSMARLTTTGTSADVTAKAVTIGVLSNTLVKLGIAVLLGHGAFRPFAAAGLTLMAAALGAAVIWWW